MMSATITTGKRKIRQRPDDAITEMQASFEISYIGPKSVFSGDVSAVETNAERGEAYIQIDGAFICFCIPIDAPEWIKVGERVVVDTGKMKVYKAT